LRPEDAALALQHNLFGPQYVGARSGIAASHPESKTYKYGGSRMQVVGSDNSASCTFEQGYGANSSKTLCPLSQTCICN